MIDNLKPSRLWHYFSELSKIPRCSKNEEASVRWLEETAEALSRFVGEESPQNTRAEAMTQAPNRPPHFPWAGFGLGLQ